MGLPKINQNIMLAWTTRKIIMLGITPLYRVAIPENNHIWNTAQGDS